VSEPDNTDSQGRFEAVLAEIGPQVSKYAARRLPEDRHQAEDFVQEAAVDLFQQWQQNEMSPNEAAAMMKRSILCDITDHLRKKTRRRTDVVGVDDQVLLDHLDANPSPEQEVQPRRPARHRHGEGPGRRPHAGADRRTAGQDRLVEDRYRRHAVGGTVPRRRGPRDRPQLV
jgi:DNA-directed RNA polymerase specialized sigma24 family protein